MLRLRTQVGVGVPPGCGWGVKNWVGGAPNLPPIHLSPKKGCYQIMGQRALRARTLLRLPGLCFGVPACWAACMCLLLNMVWGEVQCNMGQGTCVRHCSLVHLVSRLLSRTVVGGPAGVSIVSPSWTPMSLMW